MATSVELALARQRLGLSLEELSRRTRLPVESLEAIEQIDADRLPGMVHLRSCVAAFAAEVGLDPDEASERYIAELPDHSALEEFVSEDTLAATAARDAGLPLTAQPPGEFISEWPSPVDPPSPAHRTADWNRLAGDVAGVRLSTRLVRTAGLIAATIVMAVSGFWLLGGSPVAPPASLTPPSVAESVAPRPVFRSRANVAPVRPAWDLSGPWMLTNHIERSTMDSFINLRLGFRVQLDQTGTRVRGRGVKWIENGRRVGSRAQTPIALEGTIDGNRLALAITERGARRTSHGTLDLELADDGSLRGRFASDAGRSTGRAQAIRLSSPPD